MMVATGFLPPAAVTVRKILLPNKSRLPRKEHSENKRHSYSLCMKAGSGKRLPDFDRNYYDELKAEYGHLTGVSIFSKEDYTLEDHDVPWLFDDRARDIDKIREDLKHAPVEEGELEGLPTRPMRISDLHTKEEIDEFEGRFRFCDPVKGDLWDDPISESDFEGDPNWIDLRKIDDSCMKAALEEPDIWHDGTEAPVLKREQYSSDEQERDALVESFERLQIERNDVSFEPIAHGERNTVPDPEEFVEWQREAEARGGNSTEFESYFLSPFSSRNDSVVSPTHTLEDSELSKGPQQHQSLVDAHKGQWKGSISVISVFDGGAFSPHLRSTCPVQSEITELPGRSLEWTTSIGIEGEGDAVSSVIFSSFDCKDALLPGRAVSGDGSYVCKGYIERCTGETQCTISLSPAAVKQISHDESCHPVVEIGLITKLGGAQCRYRVILCINMGLAESDCTNSKAKFSTAIIFTEFPTSTPLPSMTKRQRESSLPVAMVSDLLGTWNGSGFLLQPEYPPMSSLPIETTLTTIVQKTIEENDVSFVENMVPEHPDHESKRRARTVGKKKISKRVAASRAYDRRRLADCNLLSVQKTGNNAEERFAWQTLPDKEGFSFLYSPRVGRFVDDYCGLVVSNSLLCTFPLSRATPTMWNEIKLTELTSPRRKCITVGRNEFGDVVGVLFMTEFAQDSATSDSVASDV